MNWFYKEGYGMTSDANDVTSGPLFCNKTVEMKQGENINRHWHREQYPEIADYLHGRRHC